MRRPAVWSAPLLLFFLESIICKHSAGEISIFWLVSVAEETGLKLALSEIPKTGFVATRPIWTFDFQLIQWCNLIINSDLYIIESGWKTTKTLFSQILQEPANLYILKIECFAHHVLMVCLFCQTLKICIVIFFWPMLILSQTCYR